MAFWIIAAVIAVAAALLCMRIKVTVTYDGTLRVRAGALFFSFPVFPRREKPPNPKKFTPAAVAKRKKKEKKAAQKKAKKRKNKQTEKARAADADGKKKKPSARELSALIRFWARVFRITAEKFFRYLHVDVFRFRIGVATGDAAGTAVAYGAVCAAADILFGLFDRCRRFRFRRGVRPEIYADFLNSETTAYLRVTFSLRPWQIIAVAVSGALAYLRGKTAAQSVSRRPATVQPKPKEHSDASDQ